MADFNVKLMAEALGKSIENLAPHIEYELNQAVGNLAHAAHSAMVAQIQAMAMNPKNRQDYLRNLKIDQIGDASYVIYLDGEWANKLEKGFGPYSIKEKLLASGKIVNVGSRSGQPWVRKSKEGKKYAAVPFEHKPFSGEKFQSGNLADDIKKLTAMNRAGQQQSITKTFKDLGGKPIHGKVAKVDVPGNPNLAGLTKYQHVHESGKVSSVYMTFRMVHQDQPGWTHPGFKGYQLFAEAEKTIERELENIIKTLL